MRELGRQVYLGGYEHAEHAAEAYDVAAIKCRGFKVKTNFDVDRQAPVLPTAQTSRVQAVLCTIAHRHYESTLMLRSAVTAVSVA